MKQLTVDEPILHRVEDEWPEEREPGALATLWQHRELVYSLVLRDIRSRYKQSALGIAWALVQPLAMTAVFTVVMAAIIKVPTGNVPYPMFAYVAMLPWTFFATALTSGTECLVSNFNLITKVYFPRETFPIAAVLGKTVDLGLGVLVLIPFFWIYHIHVTWMALYIVPILLIQISFLLGLTFIFSAVNLFYRDIRHVMPLLMQVWMYLTPVIYGLDLVPKRYYSIYMLNPMTPIIDGCRKTILQGQAPLWNYLSYAAIVSIVTLVAGYWLFKKLEPKFAETI
ncbi:MAG: ABC transporter permease [Armatimonadota bacterium]|nr:ABC transporter permease [bacterium]